MKGEAATDSTRQQLGQRGLWGEKRPLGPRSGRVRGSVAATPLGNPVEQSYKSARPGAITSSSSSSSISSSMTPSSYSLGASFFILVISPPQVDCGNASVLKCLIGSK